MSLSPFQKRKFDRMFAVLDVNGDGLVSEEDFAHRLETLAGLRGWDPDSPQYARNHRFTHDEWESLRDSADLDGDGQVTRDEFLRFAEIFLNDRQAVRAYARGDVQLLFDAMDTDADGKLSIEEYRTYLDVCGVDSSVADSFFAHADLDEDGRITRAEMAHAVEEFLTGQDPEAGGSYLFGPLDPS